MHYKFKFSNKLLACNNYCDPTHLCTVYFTMLMEHMHMYKLENMYVLKCWLIITEWV